MAIDGTIAGQGAPLLTPALRAEAPGAILCWLATVSLDGTPNVSPKELWHLHPTEDEVSIAEIASPISARNIGTSARACVSFVDVFRQRGWKLTGTATLLPQGAPGFDIVAAGLLQMAGPDFVVRGVIRLRVERVARILAPSYRVFPNRTVEEQMQRAYATYGVVPADETRNPAQ